MTFTEAAFEVLEREGRPMHSREIAEKAVESGLLSHVGKTPVQTMSGRLSAAVAKGKEPFVRIRPGIFALTKWDSNPPGPRNEKKPVAPAKEPVPNTETRRIKRPDKPSPRNEKKPSKPQAANEERRESSDTDKEEHQEGRRRQRGKRRSGQPDEPSETARDKQQPAPARAREQRTSEPARDKKQPAPARAREQRTSEPARDKNQPAPARERPTGQLELLEQAETLLRRKSHSVPIRQLAEQTCKNGKNGELLLEALIKSEAFEREQLGLRPRFVLHRNGWALAEREISNEILDLERQMDQARERLKKVAERQLLKRLRSLSLQGLVKVTVVYLQHLGFEMMVPVDRGGNNEFHLSIQDNRQSSKFRTAVLLKRDTGDGISEREVADMRGSLHRYNSGNAILITTGTVSEKARREATIPHLAPVALIDGEMLAHEMVKLNVGVQQRHLSLPTFDESFFGSIT